MYTSDIFNSLKKRFDKNCTIIESEFDVLPKYILEAMATKYLMLEAVISLRTHNKKNLIC